MADGKRILFVTSSAPQAQGDSTSPFILNMAQDQLLLGNAVEILAPHAPNIARTETINGILIRRFRYILPQRWQSLCNGGSALVNLRRNKLNALLIPFLLIAQTVSIWRLARTGRYDVIHSHWLLPQGLLCGLIARHFGIHHVCMVHGADIFSLNHPLFRWLKRASLRRCDAVIANSSYTKSRLQALGYNGDIHIIPTGATPMPKGCTSPLPRAQFASPETKIIIFLGRLVEEKGLRYAIESLTHLRTPAKLLILGNGVEKTVYETVAKELELHEKLVFCGSVPHQNIYDYLTLGDVFIAPSIRMKNGWEEAQGNSIIEAMFAGVPVVASDIGGIGDAVIHEQTGLLVAEREPQAIATAIEEIFCNKELRETLIINARQHAFSHFSRYETAKKIADLYEN